MELIVFSSLEGKATVDDFLPWTDLTVERATSVLPEAIRDNYGATYQWFMDHSGTVGSRMWGERIPGVDEAFSISAMRGIHVPAGSCYAVSVTVKRGSIYSGSDQPLVYLPDGTWLLEYAAHRNNTGGITTSRWNKGLLRCMEDGIPVGVFLERRQSRYERFLAFVEEYHPGREVFTLHGPVTETSMFRFSSNKPADGPIMATLEYNGDDFAAFEEDRRRYVSARRVEREGQAQFRKALMEAYDGRCACTGCNVKETLQAAHIINYRGNQSNVVINGILLRADMHLLYDSSLISVDPDTYRICTSIRLRGTGYVRFESEELILPRDKSLYPSEKCLAVHYDKFLRLEAA